VGEPAAVLADEPFGNLDERIAERLYDLLFELNGRLGQTFVIVTHNRELAARYGRTLLLEHGCWKGFRGKLKTYLTVRRNSIKAAG